MNARDGGSLALLVTQDEAFEESQKYKEGKVVIEKKMMVRQW